MSKQVSVTESTAEFFAQTSKADHASIPNPSQSGIEPTIELLEANPKDDRQDQNGDTEVSEDGFCSDDLYTTYLRQQFRNNQKKMTPSSKSSDHSELSYAKKRLSGPSVPYFGAIPIVSNEQVDRWIHYFKNEGRAEFIKWLVRGESVRHMVQPILQDSGVPIEFFYLAMVESGFSNRAYSRKRASGTWQFMPGTAKNYGLAINYWVDERRDPIKSTVAAAHYLRDLYDKLGDWYLTMAAYNAGPGRVRRAMRAVGSRDFWVIARTSHLAKETKGYVPKVLAAVMVASDMRAHGFDVSERSQEWVIPETEVILRRPIHLAELSQRLSVSIQALRGWNPELIQNVTPPARRVYALRLAPHLAARFQEVAPDLTRLSFSDVKLHRIKTGETLQAIARRYKVGLEDILAINPKVIITALQIGSTLAVPIPSAAVIRPDRA